MTGLDPATVVDIEVYTKMDAIQKAGSRAQKGAVFLPTGQREPDAGKATFFLPNGETMTFDRSPGKLNLEVRYH